MNYFLTTVRHEPVFCMLSEYLSACTCFIYIVLFSFYDCNILIINDIHVCGGLRPVSRCVETKKAVTQ